MGNDRKRLRESSRATRRDDDQRSVSRQQVQARRADLALAAAQRDEPHMQAFAQAPSSFLRRAGVDVRGMAPTGPSSDLVIAASPIHGDGLFSGRDMQAGATVCDVLVDGKMTSAASKINTSQGPNAELVQNGMQVSVVTKSSVVPGDEIIVDYPLDNPTGMSSMPVADD